MEIEIGSRVGRWEVLGLLKEGSYQKAEVLCNCGKTKIIRVSTLKSGESTSCGCFAAELASKRVTTHGLSSHPLFQTWYDMYRRCNIPSRKDYHHYGGRGVRLCKEWMPPAEKGFVRFLDDMSPSYTEGLEIDRIEVDGDYCLSNCRWTTRAVNCSNRRSYFINLNLQHNGETICLTEASKISGIPNRVLWDRMFKLGWSYDKAINAPMKFKRYWVIKDDVATNLQDFCASTEISYLAFNKVKNKHGIKAAISRFLVPYGITEFLGETGGEKILLYNIEETFKRLGVEYD